MFCILKAIFYFIFSMCLEIMKHMGIASFNQPHFPVSKVTYEMCAQFTAASLVTVQQ